MFVIVVMVCVSRAPFLIQDFYITSIKRVVKDKELSFIAHNIVTVELFSRKTQYTWYAGCFAIANILQSSVFRALNPMGSEWRQITCSVQKGEIMEKQSGGVGAMQ